MATLENNFDTFLHFERISHNSHETLGLIWFHKEVEKKMLPAVKFRWCCIHEGLDGGGGGVWYSLFIKNLAHYSSH